ncbi:hypothetical protein FA13DRAFT_1708648 [Coprinellus micaceus]|uniref:Uncharacterized protein n=1 Tax=Coprinellus micaceus TaxID=71717 RepID=A0A4Y7TGK7_COPMI|nr:hypothetical protein FA13DRAFT_1708648 [Coprinellus micaceus]
MSSMGCGSAAESGDQEVMVRHFCQWESPSPHIELTNFRLLRLPLGSRYRVHTRDPGVLAKRLRCQFRGVATLPSGEGAPVVARVLVLAALVPAPTPTSPMVAIVVIPDCEDGFLFVVKSGHLRLFNVGY